MKDVIDRSGEIRCPHFGLHEGDGAVLDIMVADFLDPRKYL
jgi:hypothetical protein